jgi:DNA polymerase-3 subunit epsilon
MRQIVLDTETTGLEPAQGHRIIEIGAVELVDRRLTGNHFHQYLQPDREIDEGAQEVHGITQAFLADKPRFADIVDDFIAFIDGAELIIHNAPFDVGFINHELNMLSPSRGAVHDYCSVIDTLEMARRLHPGQKNNLDALCKRYEVENSHRTLHGALLDSEILADVYLVMTGGQVTLTLDDSQGGQEKNHQASTQFKPINKKAELRVIHASDSEIAAHNKTVELIKKSSGGNCLWPE